MSEERSRAAAVKALNESYAIIKRLADADRAAWGNLYGWIGRQVKAQDSLELILACLKEIDKEAALGKKPDEFWSYMGGIRRRILREEEAEKYRRGEPTRAGQILADVAERARREREKKKNA